MKLSNRQRRLLEALMNRTDEVTASELAQDVAISARTVHRELQELEPMLTAYGVNLVKKSGVGISLEGSPLQLSRFQKAIRSSETETYSPDERKVLMLISLLKEREPVKLFAIASEVQAAIPTVSRDLDDLVPLLKSNGLELIRKRGYGVEIGGDETAKRLFIAWLSEQYLDPADWFGHLTGAADSWTVTRQLLDFAGRDLFQPIEQALWEQAEEWLSGLKESDYTRLLIRLTIAIARIREGHAVGPDKASEIRGFRNAENVRLLEGLTDALALKLPDDESLYLLRLLEEARERAADVSSVILEKYGLTLAEHALDLIRLVEAKQEVRLGKDRSLLDGLIRHLGPALDRIRRHETIRNPLLPQIRKDYAGMFAVVRACADEIWPNLAVPDEEIGYLTMHFGAASERWLLAPGSVRALLVCTSGIGSSKLLAVRLTKEMPQISLIGLYSWYEASRVPEDQYDLIISTVDLPIAPERYVKLSPLLGPEETERLRLFIQSLAVRTGMIVPENRQAGAGAWERLRLMEKYSAIIVRLLEPFQVYNWEHIPHDEEHRQLLQHIVAEMGQSFPLSHEDQIVQALIEREHQGNLLIPDTSLALYHTRSEWVSEPMLGLFRLRIPIRLAEDSAAEVRQILVMLAPKSLSKQALEVLSEISAMLLESELVRLLEGEGTVEQIRDFLSHHLENHIKNIMEWGDRK